jgi:peptide/nickel transport system ATP-binding protein
VSAGVAERGAPAPGAEADAAPLLEVDELLTQYPIARGFVGALRRAPQRTVHAVDGVSFTVRAGEMLALVGESGCGKTTTAQTVLRLVDPVAGRIRFAGRDITSLSPRQLRPLRREMQLIYQDPYESLDPRFSVHDTVEEPLLVHGEGGGKAQRRARVLEALQRAGLTPPDLYVDRYPHELSGGQRQRVAIAASLILQPKLLVADEPVSMLDVSVRAGILALLDGLRRDGLGILMITHDLSTAAHFADRIAVMYLGRIVEEGPAKRVVREPQHPYTRALISVVPARDPRHASRPQILGGETPNPVDIPSGCRFHPRCPERREQCPRHDPMLWPAGDPRHRAACVLVGSPRVGEEGRGADGTPAGEGAPGAGARGAA